MVYCLIPSNMGIVCPALGIVLTLGCNELGKVLVRLYGVLRTVFVLEVHCSGVLLYIIVIQRD